MKSTLMFGLLGALVASLGVAQAEEAKTQAKDQAQQKTQAQERIYGSQLMTQQERNAYRQKMRAAKTQEEREQIRLEHHKEMQQRAKEKGVTLPDEPPARGGGMGPGSGMGPGGGPRR